MSRIKAALATLAVTATGLAGALAVQSPAAATYDQCPDRNFCIFYNADSSGYQGWFTEGTDDLGVALGGKLQDQTSAVWNRSTKPWCLYEHAKQNGTGVPGHALMVWPGWKGSIAGVRASDGFAWNDQVSSLRPAISGFGWYCLTTWDNLR
ncbi:peptidase inhibitor family I36 protein [Longispora albida]|uniref:peptidase inhibitor family I36 protein n=1 Tax=Longispora albida TaxID=203523 RepID=UPI000378D296|nr:peptidase inhibitor family I36 protein [Longispora albida]